MTRCCSFRPKKKPMFGCRVSHSHRKTKRKFCPNLGFKHFLSDMLGSSIRVKLSMRTLSEIDQCDSFDAFLLKLKEKDLVDKRLRRFYKRLKQASREKKEEKSTEE